MVISTKANGKPEWPTARAHSAIHKEVFMKVCGRKISSMVKVLSTGTTTRSSILATSLMVRSLDRVHLLAKVVPIRESLLTACSTEQANTTSQTPERFTRENLKRISHAAWAR